MLKIGLTGSIGMGKSTTAQMFRDAGIPVFDADAAVHELYDKDGAAVALVEQAFPGVVRDGAVDRERLRQRVLHDPAALKKLSGIVHPLVGEMRAQMFRRAEAEGKDMFVMDVPLLYEGTGHENMDVIVVVSAPYETQRARVLARPGMTEERFQQILAQQTPDSEKRARADYVVETGEGLEPARRRVAEIIAELRARGRKAG